MAHKYLIKDIAFQAGVGVATVDRVLSGRLPVRPHTRRRVEQAIAELDRQEKQVGLTGRKFLVDVVIEAPRRFCKIAESAMIMQAPSLQPAIFRARFTTSRNLTDSDLARVVKQVIKRGSDGVILTARETAATRASIAQLWEHKIPVVTLATDVTASYRIAYAGLDNKASGRTAAFLAGKYLRDETSAILITMRNHKFQSEEARVKSFREVMTRKYPNIRLVEFREELGATSVTEQSISKVLNDNSDISAIYSIGGNNRTILKAAASVGSGIYLHIAHDLDQDNESLLRDEAIDFIINHDMERDMRDACRSIMRFHRMTPSAKQVTPNRPQILTRHALPQI